MLALNAWRLLSPGLGCNFVRARAGVCTSVHMRACVRARIYWFCVCAHVFYDVNSYVHDAVIVCVCACYLSQCVHFYLYQSHLSRQQTFIFYP